MSEKVDNRLYEKLSTEDMIEASREAWEHSWRVYFDQIVDKIEEQYPETD